MSSILASKFFRSVLAPLIAACCLLVASAQAGLAPAYRVLEPISHGSLAIFPVVAAHSHDASAFLTLDEGARSGEVLVTEAGSSRALDRDFQRHDERGYREPRFPRRDAEVNRLLLTNNSARPLLLLAGEIVTGGKQDRVIDSDRIVPPHSGPIDLGVFCVEPGRWVSSSETFSSMHSQMAQPSVRSPAMSLKDQSRVWQEVGNANRAVAKSARELEGLSSYAKVFDSAPVRRKLAEYGGPEHEQMILRQLRSHQATGVIVAVAGRIVWADLFASSDLLARYWPKLYKSYLAEAMTSSSPSAAPSSSDAEAFLASLSGNREVTETSPGVFRRAEITGDGYRVFQLTSLLPGTGFEVHIAKLRQ